MTHADAPILAVACDLDGTLIGDDLHLRKHRHVLEDHLRLGSAFNALEKRWNAVCGLGDRAVFKIIAEELSAAATYPGRFLDIAYEEYRDRADRYFFEHIHELKPRDGAEDILNAIIARDLLRSIATNGTENETIQKLHVTGILSIFINKTGSAILGCADSKIDGRSVEPKPAADIYTLNFRELRAYSQNYCAHSVRHPSQLLALEDTITGATAALRAGCRVILWERRGQNAHLMIESDRELRWMLQNPNLRIVQDAATIVSIIAKPRQRIAADFHALPQLVT